MKYKVGDVVRIRVCARGHEPSAAHAAAGMVPGREFTILRVDPEDPNGLFYESDLHTPCMLHPLLPYVWFSECCIEPKRPEHEQTCPWSQCAWRPAGVSA